MYSSWLRQTYLRGGRGCGGSSGRFRGKSETQPFHFDLVIGRLSTVGLFRGKAPNTTRLVSFDGRVIGQTAQFGQDGIVLFIDAVEEAALPLHTFIFFFLAQSTLGIFNGRLGLRHGVHVTLVDALGDIVPGATTLVGILLGDVLEVQRCYLGILGRKRFGLLGARVMDGKRVGPLSVGRVERVFLALARLEQTGEKIVLLAAQPALSREVNLDHVARRAGDACCLFEFDKGRAVDESLNVQRGQSDEVFFLFLLVVLVRVRWGDGEHGVA